MNSIQQFFADWLFPDAWFLSYHTKNHLFAVIMALNTHANIFPRPFHKVIAGKGSPSKKRPPSRKKFVSF